MSVQLLSSVWNYEVTGNTRAVIQVLCDYANDDGICWPSNDAVAFKVGVSKRQVQRILGELTEKGAVEALETGGKGPRDTNKIRVNLNALPLKKGDTYMSPITAKKDDIQVSPIAPQNKGDKGDISTHKGDISGPKGDIWMSPEPSIEPSIEPPLSFESIQKKPLPQNGIAQQIVAAYCKEAGIDAPAVYGKAVGLAKQIANAGVRVEDIPSLYAFAAEWKGTADLGLMLNQIDRWRAKPKAVTNGRAPKLPEDIQRRIDRWLEESRELGLDRPMAPSIVKDVEAWKQAQHIGSLT